MARRRKSNNEKETEVPGRTTRSSPKCMYEFMGESPDISNGTKTQKKEKSTNRSQKRSVKKQVTSKPSGTKTGKMRPVADKKVLSKNETPKTRSQVPLINKVSDVVGNIKPSRHLRNIQPIAQPNLDDISPIVSKVVQHTKTPINSSGQLKRKLRSSITSADIQGIETPPVSFIESQDNTDSNNDSGLFVSPRKTMPIFSNGKTSTPASFQGKNIKKVTNKLAERQLTGTNTSTPNDLKPKRNFTGLKNNITKLSPVQRTETPTSDYGSMECFLTPSPTPAKQARKKRASSPAFTLDDHEEDSDSLSLNKSTDKVYKKSKRKYDTGRQSASKLEEWALKVNSELEDIENFELSVEG